MIRFHVAAEGIDEIINAAGILSDALNVERPKGLNWTYYRQVDSGEFLGLLELPDGVDNPLPAMPEGQQLGAAVAKWITGEAAIPEPVEIVGSFNQSSHAERSSDNNDG